MISRSIYYLANDIMSFLVDESRSIMHLHTTFIHWSIPSIGRVAGWFHYLAAVEDAVKIQMGDWQDGSVDEDTCCQSDDLGSIPVADMVEGENLCRCHVECTPTRIHKQTNQ